MEFESLYAALGIETGAGEEAPEQQEVADPADATEGEGATEQEVADPAGENSSTDTKDGKKKQSPADNAKYARQRRAREMQEAIDAAKVEERQNIERILQAAGLVDPSKRGGKITTIEQLQQLEKDKAAKNAVKALNENGDLTEDELMALLQSTESGRELLRNQMAAQAEKAVAFRHQQIGLISQIDPSIKTFEDLQSIPEYEVFEKYVREHNLPWTDAFKLACSNRLAQKGAAAARQETLNNIGGKSHLTPDSSTAGAGIDLPKDIEKMYKAMDPSLTHEQCVKKYNDYLKRTKKG